MLMPVTLIEHKPLSINNGDIVFWLKCYVQCAEEKNTTNSDLLPNRHLQLPDQGKRHDEND